MSGKHSATTHVLMVVDKSGSMFGLAGDVRGGFNAYVDGLKKDDRHNYRLTVALFDTEYTLLCVDAELDKVPELDYFNYLPGGNTALYDAVCRTVIDFENAHTKTGLPKNDRVLVVIQTDGLENSSREYTASTTKMMLDARQELQRWSVIYLGAGMDTWLQAQRMGVRHGSYVNTRATGAGTRSTYDALRGSTVSLASTGVADVTDIRRKAGVPDDAA
jgi:hypothetical protein